MIGFVTLFVIVAMVIFCIVLTALCISDMSFLEHKTNAPGPMAGSMRTYVAFRNLDKTQTGLCLKEHYFSHWRDVEGQSMPIFLEFKAASWEEANIRFDKFLDGELS